jgi:hypothetical protein
MLFGPCRNIFSTRPPGNRPLFKMATKLQVDCLWQAKFAIHILCMCKLHFCCVKYVIQLHLFHYFLLFDQNQSYCNLLHGIRINSASCLNPIVYQIAFNSCAVCIPSGGTRSDLFCTTWAHWYKSLSNISAWGSVSAFVQSAPKYFIAVPLNSIKSYLNWQDVRDYPFTAYSCTLFYGIRLNAAYVWIPMFSPILYPVSFNSSAICMPSGGTRPHLLGSVIPWVLTFPLEDCSEFGNFVITLIYVALPGYTGMNHCWISRQGVLYQHLFKVLPNILLLSLWIP